MNNGNMSRIINMLTLVNTLDHPFLNLIKDDPVRPEIPAIDRIGNNRCVFVLENLGEPSAVVCVSYQDFIPTLVSQLIPSQQEPETAIFYTIWSYKPGAGRDLILAARNYIMEHVPSVKRFVTLSPKTEMARRFHLKNGAAVLQENTETVNYEYA